MSIHVPHSPSICVHSVCLLESYRKKGIGSRMMREFYSRVRKYRSTLDTLLKSKPKRILLLCHDDTRHFYETLGFVCKGKSNVVYGPGVWYEMHLGLDQI
jgi:GNAT superfamily N-acetyltransferase